MASQPGPCRDSTAINEASECTGMREPGHWIGLTDVHSSSHFAEIVPTPVGETLCLHRRRPHFTHDTCPCIRRAAQWRAEYHLSFINILAEIDKYFQPNQLEYSLPS